MTAVLLSAGKATRLGLVAPAGCKALLRVGDGTMLDHWRDRFPDLVTVCRSTHADLVAGRKVIFDGLGGPARALAAALPSCDDGPVTVIYADTWSPEVPEGDHWCAVAAAAGGRNWDVIEDGLAAYRSVGEDEVALVCIGLYRFPDKLSLSLALSVALIQSGEVGLADVVNELDTPLVPVVGWRDVGDLASLKAWRAA